MHAKRFSSGVRFCWRDITYEVRRLLPAEQVNIENILTGATLVVEMPDLVEALFDGNLQFVVEGKQIKNEERDTGLIIANEYSDLSDCPEELLVIARHRFEVIKPLLTMEKRTRKSVEKRVQEVKATKSTSKCQALRNSVSVASVYRWISDYTKSGNDLRSLIPKTDKRGGKGTSRLGEELETMVERVIEDKYYIREKVTIEDIGNELAVRIMEENQYLPHDQHKKAPSKATLARRIGSLEVYKRLAAKHGTRVAKQKFCQYGQTEYPIVPLERVEIDHTISDLIVIDDRDSLPLGRLTLTYCLDIATRYPLGYYLGFEPPSYLAVMECLYHAICPKQDVQKKYDTCHKWLAYGVPSVLMVDNAREFIGRDLEDACLLLGIVLQQAPVRAPHFKAGVERMYGSLNTMLFHTLPGTTFSNLSQRGDYDSSGQACVYLSDIDKMLNIFIVDIYAQRFHRGLNGIPARRWEELTKSGFVPGLPPNADELSILLGRTSNRVIHHYGIEFACLRYNCEELTLLRARLRGEKAKIKYHPGDLSRLFVYDPFEKLYIQVPALDQEYTQDLSLWKHRIIRQEVQREQRKVDHVALGQAKRKIQNIVEQGRRRKRQHSRSRIARWDTTGKPIHRYLEKHKTSGEPAISDEKEILLLPKTDEQISLLPALQSSTDWEISYSLIDTDNENFEEKKNG